MKTLFAGIKTTALVVSAFLNGALCAVIAAETAIIYFNYKDKKEEEEKKKTAYARYTNKLYKREDE